jgi:hypothetical protein
MAVNPDIMELVGILNEEGFEALAGELLTEIGLGRELPEPGDYGAPLEQADALDPQADPPIRRQAIPEDEQLGFAMRFLRLRLVEPVRRLAEAERLAGSIQSFSGLVERAEPISITFIPTEDGDPPKLARKSAPGDQTDADELARLLSSIAREIA